jgi:hypothetical protein
VELMGDGMGVESVHKFNHNQRVPAWLSSTK